jgi:Fe-S-cluster containining protein
MALFLDISLDEFSKKYLRVVGNRISLKELLPRYDCVFFKEKKCTIYEVRPKQCQTYPFWPMHLKNEEAWENVKKECEGIDPRSPLPVIT